MVQWSAAVTQWARWPPALQLQGAGTEPPAALTCYTTAGSPLLQQTSPAGAADSGRTVLNATHCCALTSICIQAVMLCSPCHPCWPCCRLAAVGQA